MKIRMERSYARHGYNIWVMDFRTRETFIAKPIEFVFEKIEDGALLPEPTLFLSHELADVFLPELQKSLQHITWLNKEDITRSGQTERLMKAHLEDLRFVIQNTIRSSK